MLQCHLSNINFAPDKDRPERQIFCLLKQTECLFITHLATHTIYCSALTALIKVM